MTAVYRLGHQTRSRYWPYLLGGLIIICLVVISVILPHRLFQPNTSLTQSQAVTKSALIDTATSQHITKGIFGVDLPLNWQLVTDPHTPYAIYSWQGGGETKDAARRIDIYIDNLPSGLAVNRLLPVESDADHLTITGSVSDNCANFTDKSAPTGAVSAKWGGVNFLCDTANYERDVVATGSAEGVNTITVNGPTAGRHRILLTYTDNSANADYNIFIDVVKSFHIL